MLVRAPCSILKLIMICLARAPPRPTLLRSLVSCAAATGARTVAFASRSGYRRIARRDSDGNSTRPTAKFRVSNNGEPHREPAIAVDVELGRHPMHGLAGSIVAELLPLCEPHGLRSRLSMTEPDASGEAALVFEHR